MTALCIELLSPLCPASGMGRAGVVDRDVTFTREGLPYIPARRLKGLLREALGDLAACTDLRIPPAGELLGESGSAHPSPVRLESALLDPGTPDSSGHSLAQRLATMFEQPTAPFSRDDVIRCFTEVRKQTAIERKSGTPLKDTLRATRTVRAGLRFRARVSGLDDAHRVPLALAAAAIRSIGSSRNRGLGEVRCWLEEDSRDLTKEAIEQLGLGPFVTAPPNGKSTTVGAVHSYSAPCGKRTTPDTIQRFTLELDQAAVFPNLDGDPNTVLTSRYIPGSAIRGFFATSFLESPVTNHKEIDTDFYSLFCSGNLLFLSAYPQRGGLRATPLPHSIRSLKSSEHEHVDLVRQEPPSEPVRRVTGKFYDLSELLEGNFRKEPLATETQLQYHHQRASDRLRGRATKDSGALFTYESIVPDQAFTGALLGSGRGLAEMRSLVASGTIVSLGRSKSAQYGGSARFIWEGEPVAADQVRESSGWRPSTPAAWSPVGRVIVTLLSPALTVNEYGHPAPAFPLAAFAKALNVDAGSLHVEKAFTRTRWQGGYLAHQGLPLQQFHALQEGSVFVIETNAALDEKCVRAAEMRSYGLRIEDGFGRIAISMAAALPDGYTFRLGGPLSAPSLNVWKPGEPGFDMLTDILRDKAENRVSLAAWRMASNPITSNLDAVSNHLLSRLSTMAENGTAEEFQRAVRQLRGPAKKRLDACLVRVGTATLALSDFLADGGPDPGPTLTEVYRGGWAAVLPRQALDDPALLRHLRGIALRSYLTGLSWRKRGESRSSDVVVRGIR